MKKIILAGAAVLMGTAAYAQSAVDAYRLSQPDLKGTARYMSMGGAFGALGGDLSVLSHNPGGIGVYRNSEVGITLDLDIQHAESTGNTYKTGIGQTKFLLNNLGIVWTLKLPNASCPNINFGFTYNKTASFNRRYKGDIILSNSLSNYIAAVTTAGGYNEEQLTGNGYDPYNPPSNVAAAPWLSILARQCEIMAPATGAANRQIYLGEWDSGKTYGLGTFDVQESGGIDSYNIAIGGNISNILFWGMDFDITHIDYKLSPQWTERLTDARVWDAENKFSYMNDAWTLSNRYQCSGVGFNYKLGFIVKPIQEFRIGFAFETPTWYGLTETFDAQIYNHMYPVLNEYNQTNDGWPGTNDVNFRTPWKINASAAAVLFERLIIAAEYEWTQYKGMKYSMPSPWNDWYDPWDNGYNDPWWPYYAKGNNYDPYMSNDAFAYTNMDIKDIYCNTNTLRLGAELRILPQLSIRAGYSYVSSPVNSKYRDASENLMVATSGTIPNYRFDNTTNYVTGGLGYRIKNFYIDLAYVYKHMESEYHAFSPYYPEMNDNTSVAPTQKSAVSLNNSQIVLSAGFKF